MPFKKPMPATTWVVSFVVGSYIDRPCHDMTYHLMGCLYFACNASALARSGPQGLPLFASPPLGWTWKVANVDASPPIITSIVSWPPDSFVNYCVIL
jgi:hypothetical protein